MITSCTPTPFVPSMLSAGNLFGTTRTSQPGVSCAPAPGRSASTSGGVIASCPGQNGHVSRPIAIARSTTKSRGRSRRSGATITDRPVIGSVLISRIEGVLEDLDLWPARIELDRHDVEAARAIREVMSGHVVERDLRDPPALERGDGFSRLAEPPAVARLDLDEHQRGAVTRDDVNFSTTPAVAPGNNGVPARLELRAREIFTGFSKGDTSLRHGAESPANLTPRSRRRRNRRDRGAR